MTKYFALIDPPWGELPTAKIIGLFREVDEPGNHSLERFDSRGEWIHDEENLARYLYQGEPGAEQISVENAERVKNQLLDEWKRSR